ncbi:MAG: TolC family protein [Planctomycetota bacterium]
MSKCHAAIAVTCALLAALASSCVPSRSAYYRGLEYQRTGAYERWEHEKTEEERRPRLKGELGLEGAVEFALGHNTQLRAMLQKKDQARGRIVEAYSETLPSADLTAGYARLDQVMNIDLGVQSFQIGDRDNYRYQVEFTQPIYKGGLMHIARRAARVFSYMSDEQVRGTVGQVVFDVAKAYYDAVLADRMIKVQEAALEATKAHLEDVRSRKKHGTATEYDVLRTRVDMSNIRADLIRQRNQKEQAVTRLLKAMGASQRSDVKLAGGLDYQPTDTGFEEAVRRAFKNRPDIYAAELGVDLQKAALDRAWTRFYPRLNAYFWHLWAKPDPAQASQIEWGRDWETGLALKWPLFDGLAREGQIIQQRALLRQRRIELTDAEETAITQVRNALVKLENARELVESQKLNLQRADRARSLVQAGYREGVNTQVEVLDATAALREARGLYYQALHEHITAVLQLKQATGQLSPAPGTQDVPEDAERVGGLSAPRENGQQSGAKEGPETTTSSGDTPE